MARGHRCVGSGEGLGRGGPGEDEVSRVRMRMKGRRDPARARGRGKDEASGGGGGKDGVHRGSQGLGEDGRPGEEASVPSGEEASVQVRAPSQWEGR